VQTVCTNSFKRRIKNIFPINQKQAMACDKCSLPVPLDSSNSVEKLCGSWVQTRGYEACVFCMPIPTRLLNESAHETQSFSTELRKTKKVPTNT